MKLLCELILCPIVVLCLALSAVAQPIGNTYVAGTTWYEWQSNDSGERMVAVGADGHAHLAWMKGLTPTPGGPRHVYYNRWDPDSQRFAYDTAGVQVNSGLRAGYVTLATWEGECPVLAYHGVNSGQYGQRPIVSLCRARESTPDTSDSIPEYDWPRLGVSTGGRVHMLTALRLPWDEIEGMYYSQGQIRPDSSDIVWRDYGGNNKYMFVDSTLRTGHAVATSRTGRRVAMCWTRPGVNHDGEPYPGDCCDYDLAVRISEDDGDSWGPELDVTNFVPGDSACLAATGDTLRCNRDTLRAFQDGSLVFDANNVLHMAFTTMGYWTWRTGWPTGANSVSDALIWHWNEATGQFSLVAGGWVNTSSPGWLQLIVCRPSIAIDPSDGYLYCAYMRYDTAQASVGGFFNSDIWISVSTDNGVSWSTGTNVTPTRPDVIPSPAGECLSERDPTLAETVSNGFLHLSYVLDFDAGAYPNSEGTATLNNFIYQRVPVDSIATTPLMPRYPMHWDSTGFLSARKSHFSPYPLSLSLSSFPNPFNNTAVIPFDLPARAQTTLKVFDLLGREVTTLQSGMLAAGEHAVRWDARQNASVIYFVSLRAGNAVRTQKMMLLK